MKESGEPSCVAKALAKVLNTCLDVDRFTVTIHRYADGFADYWTLPPTVPGSAGPPDLVIVDGRLTELGEHADYAGAIAWMVAYVLSGKADTGPRYLVTDAELPPHLRGICDLLQRAIAPHVVVGVRNEGASGWVDVPDLLVRLQQPAQRYDSARVRLKALLVHDFLAPERRHSVSNLVSPMLLAETLRQAALETTTPAAPRVVKAIRGQLSVLGLLDPRQADNQETRALGKTVKAAQYRIRAACGGEPATHPIGMHLVEDNPAFQPILRTILGRGYEYHQFLPTKSPAPWSGADSVLFLDMRLLPDDEGKPIGEASGFKYAFELAHERPDIPIVLFSTTQQRRLQDAVQEASENDGVHNLITRFSKPSLAAKGEMNAKSCLNSLKDLADAAVEAVMTVEQSRALIALTGNREPLKAHPLYAPLYGHRWLEVLLSPARKPAGDGFAVAAYEDMELIRGFAERRATDPQMTEALRVDVTAPQAAWVWALAVIRVWLEAPKSEGLADFVSRLEAGLVTDYASTSRAEEIPIDHVDTQRDTIHDVLLWATGDQSVVLSVGIKTIIQHVYRRQV